jgi:hypothetical protein
VLAFVLNYYSEFKTYNNKYITALKLFTTRPILVNQRTLINEFLEANTVVEAFALLGYYVAYVGSWLPTFRESLSVPYSAKQSKNKNSWPLNMGPTSYTETSVNSYQPTLRNIPEERRPQLQCDRSLKSRLTPFINQCVVALKTEMPLQMYLILYSPCILYKLKLKPTWCTLTIKKRLQ